MSFLLLNADGRIERDYQFNPTVNEQSGIADRYVGMWNESDPVARCERISKLWATDARLVHGSAAREGHAAIADEVTNAHEAHDARGHQVWSANATHAHHNLVKFKWRVAGGASGLPIRAGTDLLVLDDEGRISLGYRFDEVV